MGKRAASLALRALGALCAVAVACALALVAPSFALAATFPGLGAMASTDSGGEIVSIEVGAAIAPESTAYWFSGLDALESVDLHGLYSAKTTDMKYMFQNCSKLAELDLSDFDTSQATDMTGMFEGMSALEKVTLGENFSFRGKNNGLAVDKQAILPGDYWVNATKIGKPKYAAMDTMGNYLYAVKADELAANYGTSKEDKYAPGTYISLRSCKLDYGFGADEGVTGSLPTSRILLEGTLIKVPEIKVEREGYRALGWVELKDDGTMGTKYAVGASTKVFRDVTLVPRWEEIKQYTVQFSKGNVSGVAGTPPATYGPVESGTVYRLPGVTFTRPGYRAGGWIEVSEGEDGSLSYGTRYGLGSEIKVRRNVTLEPVWSPLQLSASVPTRIPLLLKADGTVAGPTASDGGSSIRNLDKYMSFLVTGVSVSPGGELKIVDRVTLAAKEMKLKVTPRKEGSSAYGTPLVLDSDAVDVIVPESGKRYEWEVAAQRELYLGLSGTCEKVEYDDRLLDSGIDAGTVTWQFGQPDPTTVAYDSNSGSGSMEAQQLTASVEFAAPPCAFEAPTGMKFDHWNTKADGSGTSYAPYAAVKAGGDMTLYAIWASE